MVGVQKKYMVRYFQQGQLVILYFSTESINKTRSRLIRSSGTHWYKNSYVETLVKVISNGGSVGDWV